VSGWLLDTDVLSAFAPGRPEMPPDAVAWIEERNEALFLAAITAMEIASGIAKLDRAGSARRAAARATGLKQCSRFTRIAFCLLILPRRKLPGRSLIGRRPPAGTRDSPTWRSPRLPPPADLSW
jgi:hypothetical protein